MVLAFRPLRLTLRRRSCPSCPAPKMSNFCSRKLSTILGEVQHALFRRQDYQRSTLESLSQMIGTESVRIRRPIIRHLLCFTRGPNASIAGEFGGVATERRLQGDVALEWKVRKKKTGTSIYSSGSPVYRLSTAKRKDNVYCLGLRELAA